MKIAPPRDRQPIPEDQAKQIKDWSATLGRALPPDYEAFLLRYNGGAPYPNIFDDATPAEFRTVADTQTFCDILYDLDFAKDETSGATYGDAMPVGYITFGEDPSGLIFLISLENDTFGNVFLWRATDAAWGSDGNTAARLFLQSPSFTAFLDSFYDTQDKIGYDHWAIPWNVDNAVEVNLS